MDGEGGQRGGPVFPRVAVVGAGLMGRGIGIEYAVDGAEVSLLASSPESSARAVERASAELKRLEDAAALEPPIARQAAARLRAAASLEDAAAGVDLVVESVPENLALKRKLYQTLGRLTPRSTVLASNTSSLPITDIAEGVDGPERVVGTHYWNPPHLMPLVEIIAGRETSEQTIQRVDAALRQMGKVPILCRKEVPGFIWNRLQMALLREALWLVDNGVASPQDVDLSIRKGLGRRYSGVGLFEAADFGGLRTWDGISKLLFPHISDTHDPGPFLSQLVEQGRYGAESGGGVYDWPPERREAFRARRDAQLLAWLRRDQAEREEASL